MDRRYGRIEPYPCSGSCDAHVLRASEVQHAVQHIGGDGHVWTLPLTTPYSVIEASFIPSRHGRAAHAGGKQIASDFGAISVALRHAATLFGYRLTVPESKSPDWRH